MKRLLLPLLAVISLPTAVNAESYWLILKVVNSLEKIEMKSLEQCEEQGKKWLSRSFYGSSGKKAYQCLEGK